jgi:hypothetical protein
MLESVAVRGFQTRSDNIHEAVKEGWYKGTAPALVLVLVLSLAVSTSGSL